MPEGAVGADLRGTAVQILLSHTAEKTSRALRAIDVLDSGRSSGPLIPEFHAVRRSNAPEAPLSTGAKAGPGLSEQGCRMLMEFGGMAA